MFSYDSLFKIEKNKLSRIQILDFITLQVMNRMTLLFPGA